MKKGKSKILCLLTVLAIMVFVPVLNATSVNCSISYSNAANLINNTAYTEHSLSLGVPESDVYEMIINAQTGGNGYADYGVSAPTASYVETLLKDGYCRAYIDSFKQYGIIPMDFSVGGSSTSSGSTASSASTKTYTDEEIAAAWEETSRTEPTCVDAGTINYKNKLTGKTKSESIEATGIHDYEVTEQIEATCDTDGMITYTCTVCGETDEETITANGHDYQSVDTVEATCTKDGSVTYECTVCGDTYTDTVVARGHDSGAWVTTKESSLFSKGTQELRCTVCDEVLETETIAQTCPFPLAVIVIIAVVVGGIVAVAVVIAKKKRLAQ
jgi:hypothetical protein